jgi:hypothetical protein
MSAVIARANIDRPKRFNVTIGSSRITVYIFMVTKFASIASAITLITIFHFTIGCRNVHLRDMS